MGANKKEIKRYKSKTARKIVKMEKRVVKKLCQKDMVPEGLFLAWGEDEQKHKGKSIRINTVKVEFITFIGEKTETNFILAARYGVSLFLDADTVNEDYYSMLCEFNKRLDTIPTVYRESSINKFLKTIR